ncbi:hypothetical protein GCM10009748_00760 [Agromyces lapidis]
MPDVDDRSRRIVVGIEPGSERMLEGSDGAGEVDAGAERRRIEDPHGGDDIGHIDILVRDV